MALKDGLPDSAGERRKLLTLTKWGSRQGAQNITWISVKPPLCCVSAAAMAACCEALWLLSRACLTLLGSFDSSSRGGAGLGRGTSAPLRTCRSSCGRFCMLQSACTQELSQHPWLTIP